MRRGHTLLFLILLVAFTGCVQQPEYETATVTNVVDGDTVELANGETVRLLGINTPERGTQYYDAAAYRLEELVLDETVRLEQDTEDRDQYDRLLRYVYVNETMVNAQLVREGLATTYFYNAELRHRDTLLDAEQAAQKSGTGLWERSPYYECFTTNMHPDAEGNDNQNLRDEYITFTNTCNYSVDMTRWTVKDAGTNTYTFDQHLLSAGQQVTLYTGTGEDTRTAKYWGRSSSAVWNNGGDTLYLRDTDGLLAAYNRYGQP